MGFLKGRIQGEIDVYKKNTTDLLLDANMTLSTGYETVVQNIGEVENKGLEITVNSTNVNTKLIKWSSNFNIAFNRNKVIAMNQGQEAIYSNPNWINLNELQYTNKATSLNLRP